MLNSRTRLSALAFAICLVASSLAMAEQVAPPKPLIVGVKTAPPFVIADEAGYRGLSVDLWKETADERGWDYEFREYSLHGLLDAVTRGEVDVGLGAITATAEREEVMDFAHTVYSSGIGIAVRSELSAGWLAVARALFSSAFLEIIGLLALVLTGVGLLAWLLERKRNPEQFGGTTSEGIFSGIWWAMVTMTTVGYGDVAPRTVGGRVLGLVWMLTALIIVSFFTASITSALTVGQLSNRIRNAGDLSGTKIASVSDSTSDDWLKREGLRFTAATDLDEALDLLASGKVDAVVYDAPLMRWTINERHRGHMQVLPITLERQDYAFALPTGSPLREPLDTALLKRINSSNWSMRIVDYIGELGH